MRPFSLFFIVSAIPLAGACSILSGGDDSSSNAATPNADAGAQTFYSEKPDSGSHPTARDSGTNGGGSTGFDGGASTTRKDGGTSGTGGGENCAALESCCETMSSSSGCETVVSEGNESTCASTLDSYQSGGYCTGGTQCATLSDCCATLPPGPGWADTCNQEVGIGNDTECGSLYGTYQTDGYCNGNPGGLSNNCYALSQCCESLTGTDLTTCNGYVSGNVDGTCQDALTSYEDQGLCD
jgi:hypothetical protein